MKNDEIRKRLPEHMRSEIMINCLRLLLKFNFISHLERMSQNIGYGAEAYGYNFPDIFDSCDEEGYFEEGVEFYFVKTGEVLSEEQYHQYLKIACEIYLESHPEDKYKVELYLNKILTNI